MKKILIVFLVLASITTVCNAEYSNLDAMTDKSFSKTVENILNGGAALDLGTLWESVKDAITKEFATALKSVASVLGVIFLFSIVSSVSYGFSSGASKIAFFALYCIVCVMLLESFSQTALVATKLIDDLALFLNTALPLIGTSMISGGNFAAYTAMHAVIVTTASLSANIIKSVGVPAVMLSLSMDVVGNMSENFSVSDIGKTVRNGALWIICALLTLFSAAVGICGIGAGGINGVALRGAKFVARSTIPVLGGLLSDSLEAVVSGSMMLKNALGGAAVFGVILMILYPLIKVGAVIFVYKIAAALISPFCDRRISCIFSDVSGVLSCLVGFAAAQGVCVIISITTLVNIHGGVIMSG